MALFLLRANHEIFTKKVLSPLRSIIFSDGIADVQEAMHLESSRVVLVINPGSTSTKVALFQGLQCFRQDNLSHTAAELSAFSGIIDQYRFRLSSIENFLADARIGRLDAVVGRGGLLHPLAGGTYSVTDKMVEDLKRGVQGEHASNLGGLLARGLADERGIPAFIVDPVAVDEMDDVARISGHPLIVRRSLFHALNIKAVARRVARDLEQQVNELRLIMVHLGGGISVASMFLGRVIDVNNANEMGPFSPERTGGLPCGDLVNLCFSGKFSERDVLRQISGQGGMVAYINTNDARDAYARAAQGDTKAAEVMAAMAYQIAKEIGAYATTLKGQVDAIVLTGGLANSERLTSAISQYVEFIAPVLVYPGEDEMLALAEGALRVLAGEEKAKVYTGAK
jgi:butyrate kinase